MSHRKAIFTSPGSSGLKMLNIMLVDGSMFGMVSWVGGS